MLLLLFVLGVQEVESSELVAIKLVKELPEIRSVVVAAAAVAIFVVVATVADFDEEGGLE